MTEQCRAVLSECDFPPEAYRLMEYLLCRHSPAQIMALVWKKDPDGLHNLDWFCPFFTKGYVKRVICLEPEPDFGVEFWKAYDEAALLFPTLSTFDLAGIQIMSADIPRMRRAANQSKVKKVPYVVKVWEGMEPTRTIERTIINFDIGNSGGIKTGKIE